MNPFFSVVIPTYNRASKLKKTLDSVVDQSFADFEVLVMDDGSTDDTREVVESFRDPRIRYTWAPNSGGPATPRNRGIDGAKSDWICFLDADDLWYPDKLLRVNEAINKNPDCDLICHNEVLSIQATQTKSMLYYGPNQPNFYQILLTSGNRVSTSATTVRRSFLNQFGLRFNQAKNYVIIEDYDLWLKIAFHGGRFFFLEDHLGEYIIEDDNISSNFTKMQNNLTTMLRDHVFNLQTFQSDKDQLWNEIRSGLLLTQAKAALAAKAYIESVKFVIASIKSSPKGFIQFITNKANVRIHRSIRKLSIKKIHTQDTINQH